MPYIGNQPGTGVRSRFIYTATASQTTFSGADDNGKTLKYADSDFVDVYLNGICLVPVTDYTSTSKTSVVLTQAASLNDTLEVIAYDIATIADTVSKADGGTFQADVTFADGADLITASKGTNNLRLGDGAGASIVSGGNNNVIIGKNAGNAITTGDKNTALGVGALDVNTTASFNTGLGYNSLGANTTGVHNTAIGSEGQDGRSVLHSNTTGGYNVAVGNQALSSNTTASYNTAVGYQSLNSNTTGSLNVSVGLNALYNNTTASNNTAVGYAAGSALTTGQYSTFIGSVAGVATTTADWNTFVGYEAGNDNTTGTQNTFLGARSGDLNTTGGLGVAVGVNALGANTTGSSNTAIGNAALQSNTTAGNNTAVGYQAGFSNTTGGQNTLIGWKTGHSLTTGLSNTFVGCPGPNNNCGSLITTGTKNTIIGAYDGNQGGLDSRTTSNKIVLSDGDGLPKMFHDGGVNWFIGNYTDSAYWPGGTSSSSEHAIMFQNTTGTLGVSTNDAIYFNKNNGDGTIVLFYSEGANEGSISISGSTVSYNGGHLARWSQLTDGSKDTTLLKGTVMTNLDQMAVWEHAAVAEGDEIKNAQGKTIIATAKDVADAYTENNEQLNCMAVSSVEGDPNVAGVFVNWDQADDGYNDLNIAMTGDMVIRIAQGTTVARGDLLMSAGDGTAKPQGDDIVRSKTIAKVTSINKSHTYDDGSYCVPCVLMAC